MDNSLTESFDSARGNNDRLFRLADFDNRKNLQVAFSVGDIDDFALQQIVSMKFIENLSIWFTVVQRDLLRRVSPSTSEIDEHVTVREVPPTTVMVRCSIKQSDPGHRNVSTMPKNARGLPKRFVPPGLSPSEEVLICFAMPIGWRSLALNQFLRPPYSDRRVELLRLPPQEA